MSGLLPISCLVAMAVPACRPADESFVCQFVVYGSCGWFPTQFINQLFCFIDNFQYCGVVWQGLSHGHESVLVGRDRGSILVRGFFLLFNLCDCVLDSSQAVLQLIIIILAFGAVFQQGQLPGQVLSLSLLILICNAFNKVFSSMPATVALKSISPSGSFRNRLGFSF